MEIKTESGVSIRVLAEGPSKLLFFNKPVRVIELKNEETSQLSTLLTSSFKVKATIEPNKPSTVLQPNVSEQSG